MVSGKAALNAPVDPHGGTQRQQGSGSLLLAELNGESMTQALPGLGVQASSATARIKILESNCEIGRSFGPNQRQM